MDRAAAKWSADVSRLHWWLALGSERGLPLTTIRRCRGLRSITRGTITVRNPAVAGNILRVLVFCRLTLGAKLMTQEESQPDQEGHADNRRRRQSGEVAEQGALLSGRPTGLPARVAVPSAPALIGVTVPEHWVIRHGPTYALLRIANGRPAAPSPLRDVPLRTAGSRPGPAGRGSPRPGRLAPGRPGPGWPGLRGPARRPAQGRPPRAGGPCQGPGPAAAGGRRGPGQRAGPPGAHHGLAA